MSVPKKSLIAILIANLTACGGSDSGSSSSQQVNTSTDPNQFTPLILRESGKKITDKHPSHERVVISAAIAQQVSELINYDPYDQSSQILIAHNTVINQLKVGDSQGSVECSQSGHVDYQANYVPSSVLNYIASFEECDLGHVKISGSISYSRATSPDQETEVKTEIDNDSFYKHTFLYEDVNIQDSSSEYQIQGYESRQRNTTDSKSIVQYEFNTITTEKDGHDHQIKINHLIDEDKFIIDGYINDSIMGRIDFKSTSSEFEHNEKNATTELFSQNSSVIEPYLNDYYKFSLFNSDETGYGVILPHGKRFTDVDFSLVDFIDLESLSISPHVSSPFVLGTDFYADTAITAQAGRITDIDSNVSDIVVKYEWFINDTLIEDVDAETLPAGMAKFGDLVRVRIVLNDNGLIFKSAFKEITISDTPPKLIATDLPREVSVGDNLEFYVYIADIDGIDPIAPAKLVHGPDGVNIDPDGIISWKVADNYLFPEQTVHFNFEVNGKVQTESVLVNAPDRAISSTSINGINNKRLYKEREFDTIAYGTVFDDNQNLIAAVYEDSIALYKHSADGYEIDWLYGFALPIPGRIIDVSIHNIDDDRSNEIVVATNSGIVAFHNKQNTPEVLHRFDAAINDFELDGTTQGINTAFAVIYTDQEQEYIAAYRFSDPKVALLDTLSANATKLIFANLDADQGSELVANSGLVIDTTTWQNQWEFTSGFGRNLAAGDVTNDGVNELMTITNDGVLQVFSADNAELIIEDDSKKYCGVSAYNYSDHPGDELFVSHCKPYTLDMLSLKNKQLEVIDSITFEHYVGGVNFVADANQNGVMDLHVSTFDFGLHHINVLNNRQGRLTVADTYLSSYFHGYTPIDWANLNSEVDGHSVSVIFSYINNIDNIKHIQSVGKNNSVIPLFEYEKNDKTKHKNLIFDFDGDSFSDILIANKKHSTSYEVGIFNITDGAPLWTYENEFTLSSFKFHDVNLDGNKDLLFSNIAKLTFLDFTNKQEKHIDTLGDYIFSFDVIDGDPVKIASGYGNYLEIYDLNEKQLSNYKKYDIACQSLVPFNYDLDTQQEFICINEQGIGSELIIYDFTDDGITPIKSTALANRVFSVIANPLTSKEQDLIVLTSEFDYSYGKMRHMSKVLSFDRHLNLQWQSSGLVGSPMEDGIILRNNNGRIQAVIGTRASISQLH